MTYKQWIKEVNYLVSVRLNLSCSQLERFGWNFKFYYDRDVPVLDMYNLIYRQYTLDD